MERVVVRLHVGSCDTIKKVWRFDVDRITQYSRKKVESELIQLFPDIARKGLKLKIWYVDDLAGEVSSIASYSYKGIAIACSTLSRAACENIAIYCNCSACPHAPNAYVIAIWMGEQHALTNIYASS